MYKTYSFEGTTMTIEHPGFGVFSAYGTGLGTFSVNYSNEAASLQNSADLSIVISKHVLRSGSLSINILQSSEFNDWIKKWANFVLNSSPEEFALTTITIESASTNDKYFCSGCVPQRMADQEFGPEATNRTWNILCANIDNE